MVKIEAIAQGATVWIFVLAHIKSVAPGKRQRLSVETYRLQSVGVDKGAIRNLRVNFFGVIFSSSLNNDNIAGSLWNFVVHTDYL